MINFDDISVNLVENILSDGSKVHNVFIYDHRSKREAMFFCIDKTIAVNLIDVISKSIVDIEIW